MNIKKLFGRVCSILTLIFLVQTQYMFGQGDINVVIPEASLTNTVLLLQDAKALNFAKINAVPGVPYFGMYTTSVGIDLKDDSGSPTSETIAISLGVTARAFFNLSGFRFDVVVPFSVTVFGRVTLQQHQGGYKLVANLQGVRNFNLTGTGWIDNYVQDLANGFIQHLPPISLVSETALLPNTIGSYFTSGTPTLKITNDAAILSLTLSNLPRQIIARNNYDGNFNVGQVEVKKGSNFVTYNSPHTYFAPINSIQTLRANQGVTSHNSNQYKYKNWNQQITGREAFSIQSNPFSFQVTSDLVNTADFKQVVPATISNSLEGIATGGSLIVNGISYSGSFNDYLFKEGNGITTNVPNGTLGTDWSFQGWSNGMTTPQINFAPTSATTLTANWKGRLLSSLAEATNSGNQRRLGEVTVAYSKVLCLIYESAGKIWLTISTNNGTNWTNELYLGDGKNPTLTTGSQYALMAWNTGNGSIVCRTATFDAYNLSQPALSTPVFVTSFNHKATADAKPCIVAPSHAQGSLISTLFYESHKSNAIDTTWLSAVRVLFEGGSGSIYGSFGMINSPKYASPNASMDIAAIQEESIFGNTIHLVHTNYGTGAPYPVYYATVNTSRTLTYTPVMQLTDNAFGTWQPKNLTITLDSLNNKHIGYDAQDYALNRRVLIYRSISANNQSVSPATRLYSSNTGYRKPSINFFNGTVSLVWQTDDGWTAFGSRQLNNPNWYSFGFQRGWSSANTTIRGAKRFVRTRTGSAPYLIASGTITVSGSPGGGGGGGDSQARTSTDHSGIGDELAQTATLGNNPSLEDVPFFPVERTTAVLSNQAESATLALTLADVGLNGISRTGLTYHDLGANLLPDTLALSPSNVFSLLKSRRFTLADTVNQMTATVKVHSKALYDLTQNNPVQLSVELFNVATGNSLALSQTALVTVSDTAKDFHFTMNLPNGLNGTDVELRVKVLGFAIQASHKASALNEIELVSGVGGTAIVNRVGSQATQSVGSVPTKFALHQNYPNPFNPVTVIRYELPNSATVKLQVFDVLGRVVATVVNERKEAGIYEAVFNASGLSSGTYFYRLQAGTFVETKKMMLVK